MTDDLKRLSPEDPNKINVNQSWELVYWSKKFRVSPERLAKAVKIVGPMVIDVKKHLDA